MTTQKMCLWVLFVRNYHVEVPFSETVARGVLLLKVFLEISQSSQENTYLCQSLFLNKFAGLRPAALLKKRLWHKSFPVNLRNL